MKKYYIILIAFLCNVTLLSARESYLPGMCQTFDDIFLWSGGKPVFTLSHWEFDTPIVIDGKEYFRMYDMVGSGTYTIYLREEGQRIYLRPANTSLQEELVLFDFSLNVGDTLHYIKAEYGADGQWHYNYRIPDDVEEPEFSFDFIRTDTVIAVGEMTLQNGEKRRMYRTDYNVVIEGIGTLRAGLAGTLCTGTGKNPGFGDGFKMICCSFNSELLYTMSETDLRNYGLQGDECGCFDMPVINALEPVETARLSVFPNPVRDYLELQGLGQETFVAVYDLSGQCLLRTAGKRIDVSALPSGIYLLHATAIDGRQYRNKFLKE